MKCRGVNVREREVVVGKEHMSSRDLLLRLCLRKNIYVKARKGILENKHNLFTYYGPFEKKVKN